MTNSIKSAAAAAMALSLALAGAAGAETRVRVQNDSVHPANISIDKRSRDVRPRKAASFPITGTTAVLTTVFASGEAGRGDLDVSEVYPTETDAEGNQYYCVSLNTDGPTIVTQADCQAALDKIKK